MAASLDGSRLKIARAQEHLAAFKCDSRAFVETRPYLFESEVIGAHWWLKPRITSQPPLRLSAIVGDCVTNCRAAIDYLVWELAVKYFNPGFEISDLNDRRITGFPIFRDSALAPGFADRIQRLRARRVPGDALSEITAAQPDVSGNDALLWLHHLVNHDKHRAPVLTLSVVGDAQVRIREYRGQSWLLRSPILKEGAAIRAEPDLLARLRRGDLEMDVDASVYVGCEDVATAREPLERTLEQIIDTVAQIVPRFERFLD